MDVPVPLHVLDREGLIAITRFGCANHLCERLTQRSVIGLGIATQTRHQQRRVQARVGIPAQRRRATELLRQGEWKRLRSTEFAKYGGQSVLRYRHSHAGRWRIRHRLPEWREVHRRHIEVLHGHEGRPLTAIEVHAHCTPLRQQSPVAHRQIVGGHADPMLVVQLAQRKARREYRLATQQLVQLLNLRLTEFASGLAIRFQQTRRGEHQQLIVHTGKQQGALPAIAQSIDRHRLARATNHSNLLQLGVFRGDFSQ
ncbi:MAG: hypothetical protein BWZ07_02545 [Alphaproteobacteria bacterium ADurb.BinA280]|nr:MAG: hypothetical protein BWZ07_02545 [Alphaproteobacteria bacterium ADurb.BinA280]